MVDLGDTVAIVLAAGLSQRFGPENKLVACLDGRPLMTYCLDTLARSAIPRVIVVTGHDADVIAPIVARYPFETAFNPAFREGLGGSIACGTRRLAKQPGGIFIILADMPRISPLVYHHLAAALDGAGGICRPAFAGKPGHPVLFGGTHLADLQQLAGDHGARDLLTRHQTGVTMLDCQPGAILDIDTKDDLSALQVGPRRTD